MAARYELDKQSNTLAIIKDGKYGVDSVALNSEEIDQLLRFLKKEGALRYYLGEASA